MVFFLKQQIYVCSLWFYAPFSNIADVFYISFFWSKEKLYAQDFILGAWD